jgi:hypothetical protein
VVLGWVEPDQSFYKSLLGQGIKVTMIGDLKKVRNLRGAVTDGANVGLALDKELMLNANNGLIASLPTGIEL